MRIDFKLTYYLIIICSVIWELNRWQSFYVFILSIKTRSLAERWREWSRLNAIPTKGKCCIEPEHNFLYKHWGKGEWALNFRKHGIFYVYKIKEDKEDSITKALLETPETQISHVLCS